MTGEIVHVRHQHKGAFVYELEDERLAEMEYTMAGPHTLIIAHTEVDESLKGQQIGKKLLEALVHYARAEKIRVIPLCPFARATLEKIREWQDIIG